jgi:hypothetical protein
MMKADENLQTMNQIRVIPYNVCLSLPLALLCFPTCANLSLRRNGNLASGLPSLLPVGVPDNTAALRSSSDPAGPD